MEKPFNVLILCTGNSARSLLSEALIRDLGKDAGFVAYSAGSKPKGVPHPMSLKVLAAAGHEITNLRSKSWNEFEGTGSPEMDIVITVCGNARDEVCPIWPGHPLQAHWGVPDPADVEGDGQQAAFETAYQSLKARVEKLIKLDMTEMSLPEIRTALNEIHATSPGSAD